MSRKRRNNGTAILTAILAAMIAGFVMMFSGSLFWGIVAFFVVALAIEELS